MSEEVKNILAGLAGLAVVGFVIFLWVGIPLLWMSYEEDGVKMITVLGAFWIFTPVAVLVLSAIRMIGRTVRGL